MKNTKLLMISLFFLILTSFFCFAETKTLGNYKLDSCVNLIQICASCSYVNITSIFSPQSQNLLNGGASMTLSAGQLFFYNFCDTHQTGEYIVNGIGDLNGIPTVFSYTFYIENFETNDIFLIFLILIIFVAFIIVSIMSKIPFMWLITGAIGIICGIFMYKILPTSYGLNWIISLIIIMTGLILGVFPMVFMKRRF